MSSPFDEALSSSFSAAPSNRPLLDNNNAQTQKRPTRRKSESVARKSGGAAGRGSQLQQSRGVFSSSRLPFMGSKSKTPPAAAAAPAAVAAAAAPPAYQPPPPSSSTPSPPPPPPPPLPPKNQAQETQATHIIEHESFNDEDGVDDDEESMLIHAGLKQQEENLTEALLRERHEDVQNIHSSMNLINEIQRDLAGMVEAQQEHVDVIEENAEETAERADRGLSHIERASQRDAQTRTCLFIFFIVLGVVALGIIIWLIVRSKHK